MIRTPVRHDAACRRTAAFSTGWAIGWKLPFAGRCLAMTTVMKTRRRHWIRGTALPEYAIALLVAIPAIAGMAAGGYKMLDNYRVMKTNLAKPGP